MTAGKQRLGARFGALPGSLWRHARTGGWYWSLKRPGETRRRSYPLVPAGKKSATKNRALAEACRRRLWALWCGEALTVPARSLASLIDEFQKLNSLESTERTGRFNSNVVRRFAHDIEHAWQITTDAIQAYLTKLHEQGLSAQTVHHHRNALRRFCAFLVRQAELESNPADKDLLSLPRVRHAPPRYLTDEQVEKLLEVVTPVLRPMVVLALDTGLRLGEMLDLRWQDVKQDHLVVTGKRSTSEPWRVVPVSEGALDALGKRGKGYVFGRKRKDNWCKLLSRATKGLPVFGERRGVGNAWHLLRSTWAVNMARQGATLWQLMARGGWTNPQTVMRYLDIARAGQ